MMLTSKIPTISLPQPWASLFAQGRFDVISLPHDTTTRGYIAIHAHPASLYRSRGPDSAHREALYEFQLQLPRTRWEELPVNLIVGVVDLVDCCKVKEVRRQIPLRNLAYAGLCGLPDDAYACKFRNAIPVRNSRGCYRPLESWFTEVDRDAFPLPQIPDITKEMADLHGCWIEGARYQEHLWQKNTAEPSRLICARCRLHVPREGRRVVTLQGGTVLDLPEATDAYDRLVGVLSDARYWDKEARRWVGDSAILSATQHPDSSRWGADADL